MSQSPILTRQILQYGALAAPVAFAGFPLYVLAPDFYATHHGVSLSVMGLVLLALRAFDAFQDPVIGMMSDRCVKHTCAFMLFSSVVLVVSVYALFHPSEQYVILWFASWMALAVTTYSILSINLNALGALWCNNPNAQTRISGTREALGLAGLLLAVTLPTILREVVSEHTLYGWFGAILGVIMMGALVAFGRWFAHCAGSVRSVKAQKKMRFTRGALPSDIQRLYMVYGLSVFASSIPAVLVIFFIRDRLHAENYTGLFLLLYFISGALAMPLWKGLSHKYGKSHAWLCSMLLATVSFMWAFFLGAGDVWQYGLICVASGVALGGDLAIPPAMLADSIHEHQLDASAATQYAWLALLAKVGLAIASAISLPLLDVSGFTPHARNNAASLQMLSVTYALLPCFIKLVAAVLLYRLIIPSHRKHYHETSIKNHTHRSSHHV